MADHSIIHGQCLCSAVKFEITGVKPAFQAYCHCETCRKRHSAPFVAVVAFPIALDHGFADKEGKFKVTEGADLLTSYHHTHSGPRRTFCKRCGGALFNAAGSGMAVFANVIAEDVSFKPQFHVNYGEKVLPIPDGLPKYKAGPGSEKVEEGGP